MYNKEWHQKYYEINKEKISKINKEKYIKKSTKSREEIFIENLKEKHNDKYTLIEPYVDRNTNILIHCNICNHNWKPKPRKILTESGCPNCSKIIKTKTEEKFKEELYEIHKDNIKLNNNYINAQTKVDVTCNICNYNWEVKPTHLISSKSGCPICSKKEKNIKQIKTNTQFLTDMLSIHGNNLTIIDDYINAKTKINTKCNKCDYEWKIAPNTLLSGVGCPKCKQSKGENKIEDYLNYRNIPYERQYKIEECKYINTLFFDFAVIKNNKLYYLIEFDGIQHFKPIKYFGGIESFNIRKERDEFKNKYCKENNIKLIRIPYNFIKNIDVFLEDI